MQRSITRNLQLTRSICSFGHRFSSSSSTSSSNSAKASAIDQEIPLNKRIRNLFAASQRGQLSTWSSERTLAGESIAGMLIPCTVLENDWQPIFAMQLDKNGQAYSPTVLKDLQEQSLCSIVVGHTDPRSLVPLFQQAEYFPPRALAVGEAIPLSDAENDSAWRRYFKTNPHVAISNISGAKLFRLKVQSMYFTDINGTLHPVDPSEISSIQPDPLVRHSFRHIELLNRRTRELAGMCALGFDIRVEEAFIFSIDSDGFNLMGKSDQGWQQYRLYYGYKIESQSMLSEFFEKLRQEFTELLASAAKESK